MKEISVFDAIMTIITFLVKFVVNVFMIAVPQIYIAKLTMMLFPNMPLWLVLTLSIAAALQISTILTKNK